MNETKLQGYSDPSYLMKITIVIFLGGFVSVFSASMINVTLPKIQTAFGTDVETVKWVVNINLVALSVLMPATGWLVRTLGLRNIFMISLSLFTFGAFLCASAWSINSLLVYRVVEGAGGGLLWPLSVALITMVFPPEERGRGMAFYGIGTSTGGTIGPLLGGYLVDSFSWRLNFYLDASMGLIGLLLSMLLLRPDRERVRGKFDFWGFSALSIAIVSLLVALSEGRREGWGSDYILGLFAIFAISFCVWMITALKRENPLIDLRIFRNRHFVAGTVVYFLVGVCLFGTNFLMPLFMDRLLNYSVLRIATAITPGIALSILTTRIGGILSDAFSPRLPTTMGLLFWAAFAYAFSQNDLRAGFFAVAAIILLRGTGLGLSYTPAVAGAMLSLPSRFLGAAAGMLSLAFTLGGMFGIAFLGTMLEQRELIHYASYATNNDYASYSTGAAINALQSFFANLGYATAEARGMALGVLRGIVGMEAVVSAFQESFIFLSITALVALVPAFFLKKRKSY